MRDFNFITDRLAWDEVAGAPEVPNGRQYSLGEARGFNWYWTGPEETPVLHIDLTDGECKRVRPDGETYGHDLDEYLDDATAFIAAHLRRGCVLVHCCAGKSRSVAVVIAYLCRYAGMSLTEALAFVSARRKGACPAPCFIEAIKRWLRLDELATKGPGR